MAKVIEYKYAGVLTRQGKEVIDILSIADDEQTVHAKDRSNIYHKYNRIVSIRIEEVTEDEKTFEFGK